jgi:hypothetical protein
VVGIGLFPYLAKRRKNRALWFLRQAAAQDAVLGAPAIPELGKPAVDGLVVVVPELVRTIGVFPNGETIAGVVSHIEGEQAQVGTELTAHRADLKQQLVVVAQELADHRVSVQDALARDHSDLKGLLDQHSASDQRNFKAIQDEIGKLETRPKEN